MNLAPGAVTYPGTSGADIYVVDSAADSTLTELDRIENFVVAEGDRVDFSATGWESGDFIYRRFSVGQPFEFTRLDGPNGFALRINEKLADLDGAFIFGGTTPPGNQSPTAVDDVAATTAGEPVTVNVLGNDSDPDDDSLTVATFDATSANGGTVARSGNSLVYTPAAGFTGTDTFDYVASDGQATDAGTVSVTVSTTPPPPPPAPGGNVVNLAPGAVTYPGTAGADIYVVDSAADSTLTQLDRIGNFVVAEGDRVDFSATGWESGDFIYRRFSVGQPFEFTRLDGPNGFSLRINEKLADLDGAFIFGGTTPPGNQSPTAVDDVAATTAGEPVTVNVLGNDSDPDGDSLTVATFDATSANGGTVARSGNSLVYTPAAGFTGTDTFDYVASDGQATDAGTVSVTVSTTPPPPPPAPGGNVVNLAPGAVTYPGTAGADIYVVDSAADSTLTQLDRIENLVVAEGDRVDFSATGWESGDFIYRRFSVGQPFEFTRLDGPNGFSLRINEKLADLDGAFIFGTAPPPPPPPPPPPEPAGIEVHDTMLREGQPTTSYQNAANVNIDGVDSSGLRNEGLLYFENLFGDGPGQVPDGAVINSATLTLNVTDGTSQPVAFHRMLTDWTAVPTLTWNSLGNGIQTNGIEAASTADVTLASIASGSRNIDVTQSVLAWASGAANFGWAILMDGSNGWDFTSSEGAVAPKLTVDWFIPTPGLSVTETGGATVLTEGGPGDTVSVALHTAPSANVTVTVAGNADVGVTPTTLTFTPGNWDAAQVVNLAAIDDALQEPTEVRTVTLTSSSTDAQYNGKNASVSVTVFDNDTPPPPPPSDPVVVAIHDTTQYKAGDPSGYGSGDPSGLAYVPGLNLLFIADSEHNESPYFSTTNLFAVRPDGTHVASYSLTAFCSEPTGLAYNPFNGFLYISDDDADQIFWVNPSNPSVKLGQFDVEHLGIEDAEDPVIDPDTGNIYVLDGVLGEMFELSATGNLIRVINLPSAVVDAEGLAYNAARSTFYVSGGATSGEIFEMDLQGNLLASFDLLNESQYNSPLGGHKPKLKGLELAPSSNPNDGDKLSLFAVDYGADQQPDGRLFELHFETDVLLT